jgi:hypothetical protein
MGATPRRPRRRYITAKASAAITIIAGGKNT